jgi:large subunit ribosomal protein L18
MSIFRSNKQIYVQLIDDLSGTTLVAASSAEVKDKLTKTEMSSLVGKNIAKKAVEKGISNVVFDRGGFLYHGRVKALADAAREGGLNF